MSFSSNQLMKDYWARTVPHMFRVVAWATGVSPASVADTKRPKKSPANILLTPAFRGRVALCEAARGYWPAFPLGGAGVYLGLTRFPDSRGLRRAIAACQGLDGYKDLVADLTARIEKLILEWKADYQSVDKRVRQTAAKLGHAPRWPLLSRSESAKVYNGRRYEDDPDAIIEPKGGRLKAPEPYFSGVSSPQGWE